MCLRVTDGDDDRLSTDNRDFLRGQRSPYSRYPVDVGGRDAFWTQRPPRLDDGPRGRCDAAPPAATTRDGPSPPVPAVQQKPRIWSLADVATSTTTASSRRRSPPPAQPADAPAARPPPPPLPLGAPPPSLALPPLPAGFQPWPNGIAAGPHRPGILAPPPAASTSSPPATHRPLPPVANGLLRYAPYPLVVGAGGHPTSHAAVSHQLAAAAAAHAAAVNAAVQARLQTPMSGPGGEVPAPSAAVGRCSSPIPPPHWPSAVAVKKLSSIIICPGFVSHLPHIDRTHFLCDSCCYRHHLDILLNNRGQLTRTPICCKGQQKFLRLP